MLGSFYKRAFDRHPWITLAVTNGALTVIADSLAQLYEHRSVSDAVQKWDNQRSGRFLAFGTAMAPLLAEWNKFLEFRFPIHSTAGTMLWGGLMRRLFMDQVLFAPFGLAMFVGSMGIMEGRRTQNELKEKFNDVYMSALLANWKIWPFLQTFNFGVLPLRYLPSAILGHLRYCLDFVPIHFKPT
ncbi:Similar to S.cerevisiae protein SYM1 (Protein required for ethanol metabolism) [Malassezia sympodialis ATCC 42132]|uniref:Similar to S.cerevisiae protein SYM1 (Protein required for ethanol metabolism) n=1 Tax=Malassezia sympodialis (strain ATCC 42132) TaxID=1230383 RepID=A0A1M8AB36_MALS4|nr:Similar to S.cerevisiae protein SYM1 (Protein required for ethanol metabolism) [Malassezia sympodialis ATCC 42132]